jgi:hypothetical protein
MPMCHGCGARVLRMDHVPDSLDELRVALRRDRRLADKRSGNKVDHRIFPRERRVGERRSPPRSAFADTDPRIEAAMLADMEEIIVELQEADMEEVEQTQVRENRGAATPPAPPSS